MGIRDTKIGKHSFYRAFVFPLFHKKEVHTLLRSLHSWFALWFCAEAGMEGVLSLFLNSSLASCEICCTLIKVACLVSARGNGWVNSSCLSHSSEYMNKQSRPSAETNPKSQPDGGDAQIEFAAASLNPHPISTLLLAAPSDPSDTSQSQLWH